MCRWFIGFSLILFFARASASCENQVATFHLPPLPAGVTWQVLGKSGLFKSSDHQWLSWGEQIAEALPSSPKLTSVRDVEVNTQSKTFTIVEAINSTDFSGANQMYAIVSYHGGKRYERRVFPGRYQNTYKRPQMGSRFDTTGVTPLKTSILSRGFQHIEGSNRQAYVFDSAGIKIVFLFEGANLIGMYPFSGL